MDPITMNEAKRNKGGGQAAAGEDRVERVRPAAAGSFGAFALSAPFGPRIALAPDGPGSLAGGEGGDGGGSGGNGGGEGGDRGGAGGDGGNGGGGGDAVKPERPEYIPEDFWDAEKGFRKDRLDSLLATQAEIDAKKAQVPEAADKYEIKLPDTFKLPDGMELGEGESIINEDDPRVGAARDFAHANGMSQSEFESLLQFGAEMDIAEQGRLKEGLKEQKDLLGNRATQRIDAVTQWLGAKLGGEKAEALHSMLYTAKQVEAFEALMRLNRGDVPGSPGAGRDGGSKTISDDDWARMSPTERITYARENSTKR